MNSTDLSPFELAREGRSGGTADRSETMLLSDPGMAEFLGMTSSTLAGVDVNENTVMGLSGFWRGISIISGTIAGMPLHSYVKDGAGQRTRTESILDEPHAEMTQFEWLRLMIVHILLWGNAYHAPVRTNGGELRYLNPVAPSSVTVLRAGVNGVPANDWGKAFRVRMADGTTQLLTPAQLFHTPGLSTDGLRGLSLIEVARQSLGTSIAAEQSAARQFGAGLQLGGILTSKEELTPEQGDDVKKSFKQRAAGVRNAGDVAFIPADLTFTPWTMSNEDAQFLESRDHSIEDQARWVGLPKHLLALDGASTWGAGLKEMNHGLARYTFKPFTTSIEQRFSRIIRAGSYAEFSYAELLQPTPEEEIPLLIQQVAAKILTVDDVRRMKNLPPLPVGASATIAEAANAVGILLRSGFDPASALAAMGLPEIKHSGLMPTTVQSRAKAEAVPTNATAPPEGDES